MSTYTAFYERRKVTVQATTSYEAQQKAAVLLGVKERKRYLITVVLVATADGKAVTHDPAILG